jgi:hypothetical protein
LQAHKKRLIGLFSLLLLWKKKIPEKNNLEERFVLTHSFRGFILGLASSIAFRPEARQKTGLKGTAEERCFLLHGSQGIEKQKRTGRKIHPFRACLQ